MVEMVAKKWTVVIVYLKIDMVATVKVIMVVLVNQGAIIWVYLQLP